MRVSRVREIVVSAVVAAMLAPAQVIVQHAVTNGGNGPIGGSSAVGLAPAGGGTGSTTSVDASKRGILLYGKVVMPDGTPPPGQVTVERVCGGSARPQAYTDSKGNFSFEAGRMADGIPDAAVNRTGQPNPLAGHGCDLRASLAGYRSDVISLAGRSNLDEPNVGTIFLHRRAAFEGSTVSATSALAPKDARKNYEKGIEAAKKSKVQEAQTDFLKATELYPRYASAWFELGRVLEQQERIAEARDAYAKAIAADGKFVNPYERLYTLSIRERKWEEAAATTDRVMHLNPYDFPDAFYYNAVANLKLDRLDVAEKSAREGAMARNPKINYLLGVILVKKQDLKGAAECFREYLKSNATTDRELATRMLAEIERQL
jgi:TolA-binding protein